MPRFLRESWGYPSKLCSVSSLDSWNFEFCGFLSAKPLRWRQPAEDPRKLGKYVNTGAEQEPLGDWVQGPPPLCRSFLCCQSSKGLNHKNAMEMTVQDFPRLKWIIHRPTLRQVLRLLKQEDPGGLLTPCFFFAAPKAAEHDQRWSFAFFLPSNCQSICEDFFWSQSVGELWTFFNKFSRFSLEGFFLHTMFASVRGETPYDCLCFVDILPIILMWPSCYCSNVSGASPRGCWICQQCHHKVKTVWTTVRWRDGVHFKVYTPTLMSLLHIVTVR